MEAFPNRIVNIHPSLLPKFPGLESWRQALEAGAATTGCTVHYVDGGMDTGPVIAQSEVPVLAGDTAATLHARIQVAEVPPGPPVLQTLVDAGYLWGSDLQDEWGRPLFCEVRRGQLVITGMGRDGKRGTVDDWTLGE